MSARVLTRAAPAPVLLTALLVASLVGAATAAAWWSGTGTGVGSSTTGSAVALTTTAAPPSGTALVPGGTAPLVLTVTNPNVVPVTVTSVQLDTGRPVAVTGAVGACAAPPLVVSVTTSIALPAGSTATVSVPAAVTLGVAAPSGCQGGTFTVPVVLSGRTS